MYQRSSYAVFLSHFVRRKIDGSLHPGDSHVYCASSTLSFDHSTGSEMAWVVGVAAWLDYGMVAEASLELVLSKPRASTARLT